MPLGTGKARPLYLRLMAGSPGWRALSILFVAVLATYSGVWMYFVRTQDLANARGFEHAYRPSARAIHVRSVHPDGMAARAMLRAGDRIVAIDGRPVDRYRVFLDAFGRTPAGRSLTLDLQRPDGTAASVRFPLVSVQDEHGTPAGGASAAGRLLATALVGYPLIFLAVASVVLLQRPGDRVAWVMAIAFGGLIAGAPLLQLEPQMPPALRRFMVTVWACLVSTMPAALYYFFAVFPAASPLDRRVPWLKVILGRMALVAGVALAAICLVSGDSGGLWWIHERVPHTLVVWMLSSYSIACMALALASLVMNAFGDVETRRRTRVILAGTVLGFGPILTLRAVLASTSASRPEHVVPFWVWGLAVLAIGFVPLSVAYAVVKHRVMELPVLLRRSARYVLVRRGAVTIAVLLGVTATLVFAAVLSRAFVDVGEGVQRAGLVAGALFGGVLAVAGQRLWRPAEERIDRAFFRGAYDARRILERLARDSRVATDRETLARDIERALEEALQPEALYVYLRAADPPPRLVAAGADAEALAAVPLPLGAAGLVELTRRGQPVVPEASDLLPDGAFAACAVLRPELLVPMLGRSGDLEGLLVLATRLSEEPYSSEDRALLGSAAAQAGLALENIRLAEAIAAQLDAERRAARELEIAKAVQAKLLPQDTPALPTLEYVGRCLQARAIGGDYFDFIDVGDGKLALVLADISGKGISAALLMASLQAGLRAQYTLAPTDLRVVLRTVNRVFYGSTAHNHYATLFFAVYDAGTRRLQYANCGHLPPILRRAGGAVERLGPTGSVIGLFDVWDCTTAETMLEAGDTLVVFSDGATDAIDASGSEFGDERLVATVDRHAAANAPGLLDAIVGAVIDYGGTQQFDDLTLLVARGR
jgi:sigma-B regulation protein RsbU (phosphoserine phosphatase)